MTIEHQIKTRDGVLEQVALTPVKAIRRHCLECSNWQIKEVRLCAIPTCPLYPYRMGRRPGQVEPETESEA